MLALAVKPGQLGIFPVERPEPALTEDDEVKLQVLRVGICGTDREEVAGGRAKAPEGLADLVLGHELLGRVVEVGRTVSRVKPGDLAVFTVRRGCGQDLPCLMGRSDMCRTGRFRERGIWGLDGFQAEYVVDREAYIVRVPPELGEAGVLVEPLSVVEKAIDEAIHIQFARLPDAQATPYWLYGRRCLVVGLGPVGLLGAMALRLRNAEVWGLDIVGRETARPAWLEAIGGHYIDGRGLSPERAAAGLGRFDLVLEAAGVAQLSFNLAELIAPGGVLVLTGLPGEERPLKIPAADLVRRLVLANLLLVGSVNAARDHYQLAVDDLVAATRRWGMARVGSLITHRYPVDRAIEALQAHQPGEIKAVVEWGSLGPG